MPRDKSFTHNVQPKKGHQPNARQHQQRQSNASRGQGSDDYALALQEAITLAFINVVKKKDAVLAGQLEQIREIQSSLSEPAERRSAYLKLWDGLDQAAQFKLSDAHAKINDLQRRARKIATAQLTQRFQENTPSTADSFEYVLQKFSRQKVPAAKVQEFVDNNCVANFSLTSHPTNPTTVEYTKAGIALEKLLEKGNVQQRTLEAGLLKIFNIPIVGEKKTQAKEMEETIAILEEVYRASTATHQKLTDALEKSGYANKGVKVNTPIIKTDTWTTGDGDGNSNATAESLVQGITALQKTIKALYLTDLRALGTLPNGHKIDTNLAKYNSPAEFITYLEGLRDLDSIAPRTHANICNLITKVQTFGFHFAKIDVRHNADDIMTTIGRLAKQAGIISDDKAFNDPDNADKLEAQVGAWLNDAQTVARLKAEAQHINQFGSDAAGKTAARIFQRLQVIGRNPEMSDKLIIAECKGAVHGLASLLLLKATGNKVGEAGATMDLVTLSESVPDLENIRNVQNKLLSNPLYREHVRHRGDHIIGMIAKSDTVRRAGIGAEYAQESAVEDLYRLQNDHGVTVSIFNGGGAALQRGGGRLTENAYNHSRSAKVAGVTKMAPSTLTIQGHQMQILLTPSVTAETNLEGFAAQNMYAAARVERLIPDRQHPHGVNAAKAIADRTKEAKASREAFETLIANQSFNKLFETGPYIPVEFGNVSSRPSKREGGASTTQPTPKEIVGSNPQVTERRAIGVERLCGHSGTFFMTILSKYEGLQAVGSANLHNMYCGSKSAADSMRNCAIAIYMTDFDNAWQMLLGKAKPEQAEVDKLAGQFDISQVNTPEVTLAFLDKRTRDTARLVYKAILGENPPASFHKKDILRKAWPTLAKEIESRDLGAEFEKVIEANLVNEFNASPDTPITKEKQLITQATYAGGDVINAPTGLMATLTRQAPGQHKPHSFTDSEIERSFSVPPALATIAGTARQR